MPYTQSLLPAIDPRRQELANYLMSQGMQPKITGTGAAGIVQGLAGLAQAWAGRRLQEKDDAEREERRNRVFSDLAATLGSGEGDTSGLDPRYLDLARTMEGYQPGTGIDFLVTQATKEPEFMKPIEVNGRLVDPRDPSKVLADYSTPEAPRTREVRRGGMLVTEEFDPVTRTWVVVGEGPAFAPTQPQGPQTALAKLKADLDAGRITPEQYEAAVAKETHIPGQTGDQLAREIAALEAQGFDRPTAESIAYGWVKVSPPDQFGNVYLIDLRDGTSRPTGRMAQTPGASGPAPAATGPEAPAATGAPAPTPQPPNTIAEAAKTGTGPGATVGTWWDKLVGGLWPGDASLAPESAAAKQEIRTFNQIAKGALVNNPRFPVAEQELVQNLLPDPDALFTNPATEAQKARQLEQTLSNLRAQYLSTLGSGSVAQETQVEIAAKVAEIDRVLALMHTPASSGLETMEIDGRTLEILGRNPDGSIRIRDSETGRTGTYRAQ